MTVGGGGSGGGGSGGHPFKIRVSDGDMTVDFGSLYISRVYIDTDGKPFLAMDSAAIDVNTGDLRNDPAGGTAGTIALSASTTYGVWIELTWSFTGSWDKTAGLSGDFIDWSLSSFSLGGAIIVSATNTTAGSTSAMMADNALKSYIFVGRVVMDGSSQATIGQYLKSDLVIPAITLPDGIISSDSPNEIYIGTDGGLIVDP